jgi:hypothetical protein
MAEMRLLCSRCGLWLDGEKSADYVRYMIHPLPDSKTEFMWREFTDYLCPKCFARFLVFISGGFVETHEWKGKKKPKP